MGAARQPGGRCVGREASCTTIVAVFCCCCCCCFFLLLLPTTIIEFTHFESHMTKNYTHQLHHHATSHDLSCPHVMSPLFCYASTDFISLHPSSPHFCLFSRRLQGVVSFDSIGSAVLTMFVSITLEGWTGVMYTLQDGFAWLPATIFMVNMTLT